MYIYMGMFFNSPQDVPDFGSIKMYFIGTKELGYVEEGHKKFRKYAFQSTDLNKLSLITNALDGSEAFAVDTGITYVLYNNQWSIKSSELTPAKMAEMLGNITQIDYQIVNQLPQTGIKGTIYLVAHETAQGDYYDEYIWTTKLDNFTNESINVYEKIGNTAPTISTMVGATYQKAGEAGLAPAPQITDLYEFLRGNGTWAHAHLAPPLNNSITDLNDLKGSLNYREVYYITYEKMSNLLNKPNGLLSSCILSIETLYEYRFTGVVQTLFTLTATYRRVLSWSYNSDTWTYGDWEKTYPIETATQGTSGIFLGTCASAEANKQVKNIIVSDQNFALKAGTIVAIKFAATNTYSSTDVAPVKFTFNSGTNEYLIYYKNALSPTGIETQVYGTEDYIIYYMFNGTNLTWISSGFIDNQGTKVTQDAAPQSGTYDLLMAKTSGSHTAETGTSYKSGADLNFDVTNKKLKIGGNNALTTEDIIICTQDEYDAMETHSALLYFIKESDS